VGDAVNRELGRALLALARGSIAERLGAAPEVLLVPASDIDSVLDAPGATFVTLHLDGALRGCIGSLRACKSLRSDCQANAVAAAFDDPRFPPVSPREWERVRLEVSVLSEPVPFPCRDEEEACRRLVPGRHGVILSCRGHRATFLPQVWEQLPDPRRFLSNLRLKAGMAADVWPADLALQVYEVDHVEDDPS